VGPRAVLDAVVERKIPSPRQESNPRTPIVQPVAQSSNERAIKALTTSLHNSEFCSYIPRLPTVFVPEQSSLPPASIPLTDCIRFAVT
jgi:hypothetical protein